MKKVILILILIMIFLFTEFLFVNAEEHAFVPGGIGVRDSPGTERDTRGILNTVSPSIVKVIAQSRKFYFASGIAIDRRHVISNAARLVGKIEGKREKSHPLPQFKIKP